MAPGLGRRWHIIRDPSATGTDSRVGCSTFILDLDDGIKNLFILASGWAGPLMKSKVNKIKCKVT